MADIQAAAYTGETAPWILVKMKMCEFFHCLPSELEDEELDTIMQMWNANNTYEEMRAKRPKRE